AIAACGRSHAGAQTKDLGLLEKRNLMKFLQFCMDLAAVRAVSPPSPRLQLALTRLVHCRRTTFRAATKCCSPKVAR
ncbi:MAG: hypothetical protein ACK4ZJ_16950, partial [Allorhizobium sp.]